MADYDRFADKYAKQTEDVEKETRRHFYSLLSNVSGVLLLDVGCGSGHDAEHYVSRRAIVYGIDLSVKQIEIASKKSIGKFIVGDMNNLPYESNTFDIVTSVYALQESDNPTKALGEIIRVAKPGATILLAVKHPFRNLLEGHINDNNSDYYAKRKVTSHIFNRTITLSENGHTLMEYLNPLILSKSTLELFEEHTDFPASEQVIPGMIYPTYMILKFRKNKSI